MIIERPALYLVGTPIGNLDDLSPRAVEVLSNCDFIAAEDTRVTSKLLMAFDIKKPLISYFEHNLKERGEEIISKLSTGQCCALVTDAGMPAISDPGEILVKQCAEAGIPVHSVPGPSAVITALALSGLSTSRFTFEGFLSVNRKSRKEHLKMLVDEPRTMVFYEAPHKLLNTLKDFCMFFGEQRKISLCRELTKIYEEVIRTTLGEAVTLYESSMPKGEFVLVLEGNSQPVVKLDLNDEINQNQILKEYQNMIKKGLSKNEALKQTALKFNVSKNSIYNICSQLGANK